MRPPVTTGTTVFIVTNIPVLRAKPKMVTPGFKNAMTLAVKSFDAANVPIFAERLRSIVGKKFCIAALKLIAAALIG